MIRGLFPYTKCHLLRHSVKSLIHCILDTTSSTSKHGKQYDDTYMDKKDPVASLNMETAVETHQTLLPSTGRIQGPSGASFVRDIFNY